MKEKLLEVCEKIESKLSSIADLEGISITRIDDVLNRKINFYIRVNNFKEICSFYYKEIDKKNVNEIVKDYIYCYFRKYNKNFVKTKANINNFADGFSEVS